LSLYVVIIWGFIGTRLFLKSYNGSISSMMQSPEGLNIIFFMGITLFATVCLIFLGQTNQKEKRGKHKFIRR
jgi:predicted tellurium resistance membrane protein TerC